MKTWYYAVEVRHWVLAFFWSHAFVACAMLAYFVPILTASAVLAMTPALALLATGAAWCAAAIIPLREFRRQFGFWPGRTHEERSATRFAVFETLRRRAAILGHLTDEIDSMGPRDRIERDAILVDIGQEEERFQRALLAASPRYAEFGVNPDSTWRSWPRPQSEPISSGSEPVETTASA